MIKLTAVIPIQTNDFDFYKSRLVLRDNYDLRGVETLIVDYGSNEKAASEIEAFCFDRGYTYFRYVPEKPDFSLSKSRNLGILNSSSQWLIMEDADVVYEGAFYQNLIVELENLDQTPFNFITIPVGYLKSDISSKIIDKKKLDPFYSQLTSSILLENPYGAVTNVNIEHFAPASAIIALRKKTFFTVGLYDESFIGWGGEDRDLIFKLLLCNNRIKKPDFFKETTHINLNDNLGYSGWRALYALIGDFAKAKGLYGFHLYHDPLAWKKDEKNIYKASEMNRLLDEVVPVANEEEPIDYIWAKSNLVLNSYVYEYLSNPQPVDFDTKKTPNEFISTYLNKRVSTFIFCYEGLEEAELEWLKSVHKTLVEKGRDTILCSASSHGCVEFLDEASITKESSKYYIDENGGIRYLDLIIPGYEKKYFGDEVILNDSVLFDRFKFESRIQRTGFVDKSISFLFDLFTPRGVYRCDGCSSLEAFARFVLSRYPKITDFLRPIYKAISRRNK